MSLAYMVAGGRNRDDGVWPSFIADYRRVKECASRSPSIKSPQFTETSVPGSQGRARCLAGPGDHVCALYQSVMTC
jgi:hypothetical protein